MSKKKGDKLENFVKELAGDSGDKQICGNCIFPVTFDIDFIGMGVLYRAGGHTLREEDVLLKKGKGDTIFVQCKNYDKYVPAKDIEYDVDHLFGAMHVFNCLDDVIIGLDIEGKDKKILKRAGVKVMDTEKFLEKYSEPQFYKKPFPIGEVAISYGLSREKKERMKLYLGELTLVGEKHLLKEKDTLVTILNKRKVQSMGAKNLGMQIETAKRFYDKKHVRHYIYVSEKGPRSGHTDVWVERINGNHISKDEMMTAFRAKNACSLLKHLQVVDYAFPGAAIDAGAGDLAEVLAKKNVEGDFPYYFRLVKRVLKRRDFSFERSWF